MKDFFLNFYLVVIRWIILNENLKSEISSYETKLKNL